jgi:hypothetical protein
MIWELITNFWAIFLLALSVLYFFWLVISKLTVKQSPLIKAAEDLRKTEARIEAFEAAFRERPNCERSALFDLDALLAEMQRLEGQADILLGIDYSRDEIDKLAAAKMPPIEINKIPSGLNFRQDLKPSAFSYDELIKSLKGGEL